MNLIIKYIIYSVIQNIYQLGGHKDISYYIFHMILNVPSSSDSEVQMHLRVNVVRFS